MSNELMQQGYAFPSTTNNGSNAMLPSNAGLEIGKSREIARIQAKIYMACQFPRNLIQCNEMLSSACGNYKLASQALYNFKRGGEVSGPSIRLAEAIATCWGNIEYGFEEIEKSQMFTKVRAYAVDNQRNVSAERVFDVSHVRVTKNGSKLLEEPRDVYEAVANSAQRRVRACILQIIPVNFVDQAIEYCNQTLAANVSITPKTVENLISAFANIGVTKSQIEKNIQRKIESINIQLLLRLRGIYKAIDDGISSKEQYFDEEEEVTETKLEKPTAVIPEPTTPPAPEPKQRRQKEANVRTTEQSASRPEVQEQRINVPEQEAPWGLNSSDFDGANDAFNDEFNDNGLF